MRRQTLGAICLSIFLVACQPTTAELTDDQRAAIASRIDSIVDGEWIAATDPVDFEKLMSFVHESDEAAMAFNGGTIHTYATMEAVFGEHFATISREPSTITDSKTVVLAPDVVYVIRSGTFTSIDIGGNAGPLTPFTQTLVWVLRDGEWKVLYGHVSHGMPVTEET